MRPATRTPPREAGRRFNEIKPIVDAYREYRATEADLADARELLASEDDAEMREYLEAEIDAKDAPAHRARRGAPGAAHPARSRRRAQRHRRDPRGRGW